MRVHSVTARDGEHIEMQHSCHHLDIIRNPNSSYLTTKLYATSTCGCNNNTIVSERKMFTFPTVDVCRARWPGSGEALVIHAKVEWWQHCWIHYFSCLRFPFCQTCSFWHQVDFSGTHSSLAAITRNDYSITFPLLFSQALIYTAKWTGASWREWKCPNFKMILVKMGFKLSIVSLAFYRWATAFYDLLSDSSATTQARFNVTMFNYVRVRQLWKVTMLNYLSIKQH